MTFLHMMMTFSCLRSPKKADAFLMLPFRWKSPVTNRQISTKWQPEKSALPTLSKYKSLLNTIKRHLQFLPNDDSYNIHLKSLNVSSRGETSGVIFSPKNRTAEGYEDENWQLSPKITEFQPNFTDWPLSCFCSCSCLSLFLYLNNKLIWWVTKEIKTENRLKGQSVKLGCNSVPH